jgi:hypothetical protein
VYSNVEQNLQTEISKRNLVINVINQEQDQNIVDGQCSLVISNEQLSMQRLGQDQTVMKESNRQDFTLDDLDRLRQSELRPQEMIFAQIGDNGIYRPALLALLSNSLRQYSRLRREIK